MNPRSVASTIGSLLFLIAAIGLVLWALRYLGLITFGFGSLPGLIVVAVIGLGLTFVARRM